MKIPINKYVMDKSLSWEERYKQLEAHHQEETEWLINKIKQLEADLNVPPCPEGGYCNENGEDGVCKICGLGADKAWALATAGPYGGLI